MFLQQCEEVSIADLLGRELQSVGFAFKGVEETFFQDCNDIAVCPFFIGKLEEVGIIEVFDDVLDFRTLLFLDAHEETIAWRRCYSCES